MYNKYEVFEQKELEKLQVACDKYGYKAFSRFGELHIRTRFEAWYFDLTDNGTIRLMHQNARKRKRSEWHEQFTCRHTYEQIVQYVHEHEEAKYGRHFVDCSFSKQGTAKATAV